MRRSPQTEPGPRDDSRATCPCAPRPTTGCTWQKCREDGGVAPPLLIPAEELTPAFVCGCGDKAVGCVHGSPVYRFLAGAAQGVSASQLAVGDAADLDAAHSVDDVSVFGRSKEQLRVVLRGLSQADSSATSERGSEGCITASSAVSRERLLQLCIHAGYSTYCTQQTPTTWQVYYTEAITSDLPSADIRSEQPYDRKAGRPRVVRSVEGRGGRRPPHPRPPRAPRLAGRRHSGRTHGGGGQLPSMRRWP